jgi:dTDP-4-amino-4,6-dideoxygalactose transaminase
MKTNPIQLFKVYMSETASSEVGKVLNSGYIGQGDKVSQFEGILSDKLNNPYILTLNSATSGLHLALHLLKKPNNDWPGLNDGDEVLTTALTCTATNFPILANNLKIKWVDVDKKSMNLDLDDLERKITNKTKVIMLVHWGGFPNDLDRIKEIQNRCFDTYGFKPMIIEDCAHSLGSKYNNEYLGNHGNIVIYSLQAIKHITSVDGGLIVLPNKELYDRSKLLRWYGIDRESNRKDFRCEEDIKEWGFKFHMNDVCATIGIENFKHFNEITDRHKSNAKYYDENLKNIPGLTLLERDEKSESSFWIYSMLVENRENFYKWMKECGIVASQVHERNDKHTTLKDFKTLLPTLDYVTPRLVSIPVGWWVNNEEREYIVDCIKKGW